MKTQITFQPQNFGGYTFFLILTGLFLGYTSLKTPYFIFPSVIMFVFSLYFYSKDNQEEKK